MTPLPVTTTKQSIPSPAVGWLLGRAWPSLGSIFGPSDWPIRGLLTWAVVLLTLRPSGAQQPGSLDPSFISPAANNDVKAITVQADGKILIGGFFTAYNGTAINRIARLNANGSLDTGFNPGTGTNSKVKDIVVQADGKILIGGGFTQFNGITRNFVARLNTDGSLDTGFNPGAVANGDVTNVALQANGKILIGGWFTQYNSTSRNRITRLNADGSLDTGFNPGFGANGDVESMALQTDGKILIGGYFTQYNGTARNRIARLNTDGSLDMSFNPGSGTNDLVESIAVQSDGKILIGGYFTSYNSTARNRIARLSANGSLDASFDPGSGANDNLTSVAVQADSKILIGGFFTQYSGTARNRIARLNTDGSVDAGFDPGSGASDYVETIGIQADGRILIGGFFAQYNGTFKGRIARLIGGQPSRLYVNAQATGGATGFSWGNAFTDLQSALNYPNPDGTLTEIWVAAGTYKPTTTTGPDSRTVSFAMKNNMAIYGGFSGNETNLSQRNLTTNLTILSGDIGTVGDMTDNSYHVINNLPGLTSTAILDGFTIQLGNANGPDASQNQGGGVFNNGSGTGKVCSPTLRNCVVQNNQATVGGGMFNDGSNSGSSNPTLINCGFIGNSASVRGGALNNFGALSGSSSPTLINCSLQGNSAPAGGAIYGNGGLSGSSQTVLTNSVVFGNGGSNTFGTSSASVVTSYCLFESSVTGYAGGIGNLTGVSSTPFASTVSVALSSCSPAINAGNPASTTVASGPYSFTALPTNDLVGKPRIFGGRMDMGAVEFQSAPTLLTLTNPTLTTATVGQPFSQSFAATGGSVPYSFGLASGSVPPGLNLATTGVLSGTPSQAASFTLGVTVQDAQGCQSPVASYSLSVESARPDLTMILYARPTPLYGNSAVSVVVDVVELNGVAAGGSLTLKITQDSKLSLSLLQTATLVGGRSVQNSAWVLSGPQNGYYVLTASGGVGAGAQLSVGLEGVLSPGGSAGQLTVSGTVLVSGGSEQKLTNNIDADKLEYFQ